MPKLNKIYHVCKNFVDKKIIIGIIFGISIAVGTTAIAQSKSESNLFAFAKNWFSNNTRTSENNSNNTTVSAISTELEIEMAKCAKGEAGTLGAAIRNASKIHQEIAAIAPPIEELFDSDCFSGIMAIFDLSFAIPSLASIMNAVTQAVIQFAQKKICRAINNTARMIADPINQAMGKIGILGGDGLNGLVNGMVMQGLDRIDPELGQSYIPAAPIGSFKINTNPFSLGQTSFESSIPNNAGNLSSSFNAGYQPNANQINHNLYNSMNGLNEAQKLMGVNQQKILQLTPSINQTYQSLQNCNSNNTNRNCQNIQNQYNDLIMQKQQLETQNIQVQNNLVQGVYEYNSANNGNIALQTNQKQTSNTQAEQNSKAPSNSSWFNFNFLSSK